MIYDCSVLEADIFGDITAERMLLEQLEEDLDLTSKSDPKRFSELARMHASLLLTLFGLDEIVSWGPHAPVMFTAQHGVVRVYQWPQEALNEWRRLGELNRSGHSMCHT